MKNVTLLVFFLFFTLHLIGQEEAFKCGSILKDDRDGQEYKTTQIGKQCWMAQNLNYGSEVKDNQQTNNAIIEKTCYENKTENCSKYGGLYTFFEALQWEEKEKVQGVCPTGWHVPSNSEWTELNNYLGLDSAGYKVKASKNDVIPWDGSNETGFTGIASGVGLGEYFGRLTHWAVYWSSTSNTDEWAWSIQLDGLYYPMPPRYISFHQSYYFRKENSFSIRCIKN